MSKNLLSSERDLKAIGRCEFAALMTRCYRSTPGCHLVVGVSGGADSLALCLLMNEWGKDNHVQITAITVNHGIRKDAAKEARLVNQWLQERKICHCVLDINKRIPSAGLQAAARKWRFTALDRWCRENSANAVLFGHTMEDQAETVYMRILADSGPDGLSGMGHHTRVAGLAILRPLLGIPKARLIATCVQFEQVWVEDPSNEDRKFTRVRLRGLDTIFTKIGMGKKELDRFSSAMYRVRRIIDGYSLSFMRKNGGISGAGISWIYGQEFDILPEQFSILLMTRILVAIGGTPFPPRTQKVRELCGSLRKGDELVCTLAGCIIQRNSKGVIWIYREYGRCASSTMISSRRRNRWDNRFEVSFNSETELLIGPLGRDGWKHIKDNYAPEEHGIFRKNIPFLAKLSIPVARKLDGTVLIPHFEGERAGELTKQDSEVTMRFIPDSLWICSFLMDQGDLQKENKT